MPLAITNMMERHTKQMREIVHEKQDRGVIERKLTICRAFSFQNMFVLHTMQV